MLFHKTLKTNRLILRKWYYTDANKLFEYCQDEYLAEMSGWKPHNSVYYSRHVLDNTYSDKFHFAVVNKFTGELLGSISLIPGKLSKYTHSRREAELGYWMGRKNWNQGYMTEAVQKILEYGFKNCRYKVIWASAFEENTPSQRVLQKNGFDYKKSVYDHHLINVNQKKKVKVFCITKEKWLEKKSDN